MPCAVWLFKIFSPVLGAKYQLGWSIFCGDILRIIEKQRPVGTMRSIMSPLVPRQVAVLVKNLVHTRTFMHEIMGVYDIAFAKNT